MRVLVTGGAGYIGSHTSKLLAGAGHEPVALDDLRTGHASAVQWGPLEQVPLADGPAVREVLTRHAIEAVIHFAASAYVGESMRDPGKYFRNNVAGSVELLDAMVDCGVDRLIFSSSCAVYGLPERLPLTEDHPRRPVNPYGESKRMVETILDWYGRLHGLRWTSLRYFNAAGADADGELGERHDPETHIVPLAIQAAAGTGPAVSIFGTDYSTPDGTAIRDYIHVTDLADAHLRALDRLTAGGSSLALNLGTGTGTSVRAVLEAVETTTGRPVPAIEAPRREGDPPVLVADPSRAERELGWRASRSDLATIVATAVAWHAGLGAPAPVR